jgi:hypothetical protein
MTNFIMTVRSTLKLALFVILIIRNFPSSFGQDGSGESYRFIFYNVENLFDTKDDSLTDDNEFLPDGSMHWTESRYRKKINSVYKVLAAAGEWDPPALAGFCEIENKNVLRSLVYDTWLSKYPYGIVTGESRDPRGIRPGIIYRKDRLKLLYTRSIEPNTSGEFRSRMILYTKWLIGEDTIHLYLNHWPSRRRGVLAEEKTRESVMMALGNSLDSLFRRSESSSKIIIAGDLNCTPDDLKINGMINLSSTAAEKGEGTYRYRGKWEMIDQVIVSRGIVDSVKGIYTNSDLLKIFKPDFLMQKDPVYPGDTPFPTYRGFSYQGGFSDHLPLIIDLKKR